MSISNIPSGFNPAGAARPGQLPTVRPAASRPSVEGAASSVPESGATDLWSVLTSEERAFFLGDASKGPLSYGPSGSVSTASAAPLGQQCDVRA